MKTKRSRKSTMPEEGLLLSGARTIGMILGAIAAKTGSVSKPISERVPAMRIRSKAGKSRNRRTA